MAGQTDNQSAAARELARLKRPFGGRRLLSWILFFSVLGGYLALPGVAALRAAWVPFLAEPAQEARVLAARPDPQKPPDYIEASTAKAWHLADQTGHAYPPPTVAGLDRVWNPGPMSAAHAPWSGDCKVCHSTPFKRVQDADCLGCHKLIHAHVDPARVDVPALAARCERRHINTGRIHVGMDELVATEAISILHPFERGAVADLAITRPWGMGCRHWPRVPDAIEPCHSGRWIGVTRLVSEMPSLGSGGFDVVRWFLRIRPCGQHTRLLRGFSQERYPGGAQRSHPRQRQVSTEHTEKQDPRQ